MSGPLVSVIMPVHNAAPFVGEAIRSALAQTERDFELLIVDDASTDGSAEIISQFQDPRIRRLRSAISLNAAGARNIALTEARGEFIAFLDADDIARPDRLEIQLRTLRARPDTGVAGSLIESIDEHGTARGSGFVKKRRAEEIAPTLLFENCVALSSVMARRVSLAPFRPELAPAEDYDLWVRLSAETQLLIIPRPLTSYRTHPGGVSVRQSEQMRTAISSIHAAQLARLGLEPSPIHARIVSWPLHSDLEHLAAAEQWLGQLSAANDRAGCHPRAAFQRVLADRWFTLCLDSWLLGWPVWRTFHRSSLAAPTLTQSLRLFRRLAPRIFRR